ncbi:DJ-1/PfpI family protein [Microlunatus ginsengisoli]|uniref:DJ-1/PfpI domain-containing protein n=1 Tax=Microlunatus ginsengisoli TaxID=363863 RepID=A0ABP7AUH0_9ACTN
MTPRLDGKRVAILAADGVELVEFSRPREALIGTGATVVDQELALDGNLITSRSPDDLDAFCAALLDAVGQQG